MDKGTDGVPLANVGEPLREDVSGLLVGVHLVKSVLAALELLVEPRDADMVGAT